MDNALSVRVRAALTVAVTLLIVLAEFWFLSAVYHLGDDTEAQRLARTELSATLATWEPGSDPGPILDAVAGLDEIDATWAGQTRGAAAAWSADPSVANFEALREADDDAGRALADQRARDDLTAGLIHATLLVLVSIGWFFWFRKLVRRHRDLQHRLTEREVIDTGERRLMALVHNSTDLVAVLEPDGTTSFVSPSAWTVLGYDPGELTIVDLTGLVHPDDVPTFVRSLACGDGEHMVMVAMQHQDGRLVTLEGTVNNLLADDAVRGLVLTLRDVTERQQARASAHPPGLPRLADRSRQPAAVR